MAAGDFTLYRQVSDEQPIQLDKIQWISTCGTP